MSEFVKKIPKRGLFDRTSSQFIEAILHSVSMDYCAWFRILFPYYKPSDHNYSLLYFAVKRKRYCIISIMDEISESVESADPIPSAAWKGAMKYAGDDEEMRVYLQDTFL